MPNITNHLDMPFPTEDDPLADVGLLIKYLAEKIDAVVPRMFAGKVTITTTAADQNMRASVPVPAGVFVTPDAYTGPVQVFASPDLSLTTPSTGYVEAMGQLNTLTQLYVSCRRSSAAATVINYLAIQMPTGRYQAT